VDRDCSRSADRGGRTKLTVVVANTPRCFDIYGESAAVVNQDLNDPLPGNGLLYRVGQKSDTLSTTSPQRRINYRTPDIYMLLEQFLPLHALAM